MINITSQDYHLKKCSILGIEVKKKIQDKTTFKNRKFDSKQHYSSRIYCHQKKKRPTLESHA
jgi:hypothetical protein